MPRTLLATLTILKSILYENNLSLSETRTSFRDLVNIEILSSMCTTLRAPSLVVVLLKLESP